MSYADQLFKQDIRNILENGTNTRGQKVRPHWEDGTPAYTIKQFGVSHIYDLRKEFPAITVRPTALKTCMEEILWIFQRKSNKLSELKARIWDQWGDDKGTIGKAYGYQIGEKFLHHKCTVDELELLKEYPSVEIISKSDSKYDIYTYFKGCSIEQCQELFLRFIVKYNCICIYIERGRYLDLPRSSLYVFTLSFSNQLTIFSLRLLVYPYKSRQY